MANVIIQWAKRAIPAGYVFLQAMILLILGILETNTSIQYLFALLATITYLWTAFANPGYVIYEEKQQPPRPICMSQPVIPLSPSNFQQAIKDELHFELGVQSFVKDSSPGEKEENFQLPTMPQAKIFEKQIQRSKQAQKKCFKDWKIRKFQQLRQSDNQDQIKQELPFNLPKPIIVDEATGFQMIPMQLKQVVRWCNSCKNKQALRVRHCHECNRCVSTFDHHCPWMNNCIGEKNKFSLIIFALVQTAQLCYLGIVLQRILSSALYSRSLILLWLIIMLLALTVACMLAYQLFLISQNITTWENARWAKIEYLTIFKKDKLRSLFDRGFTANFRIFFNSSFSKKPTNWISFISPLAHKHLMDHESQTDRRLVAK